jgi:hypothetical protein
MTDLEDLANRMLTNRAPSGDPSASGPERPREPPEPGVPESLAKQSEAILGQPDQPVAGPEVPREPESEPLPGAPLPVPCSTCGSTEPPDAIGLCPVKTCRCTRVGNRLAVIHDGRSKLTRADFDARDALMDRLYVERGGREALDIVSQLRIEDYATAAIQLGKVTRRLEDLGAVSTAGNKRTSLVDTYNTFSARAERLAAELPPLITRAPTTHAGVEQMPTSALELVQEILKRKIAGETLSDFEQGQLAVLRGAMRGQVALPPDPPPLTIDLPVVPALPVVPINVPAPVSAAPLVQATRTPLAPERCPYCGGSASDCAAISDDPRWLAEHLARADVKRHLDAQAALHTKLGWDASTRRDPITSGIRTADDDPTSIMMRQIGRPLPEWYRR